MTQEDKELLLKDLCSRLPYGVKIHHLGNHKHNLYKLEVVDAVNYEIFITSQGPYMDNCPFIAKCAGIEEIKPYLFPLSSMTEEQRNEYHELVRGMFGTSALINFEALEEFFHKNHIDYRGLITMGLALDATYLNIY